MDSLIKEMALRSNDINFDDKLSANVACIRNAHNCTLYQQALVYNIKKSY